MIQNPGRLLEPEAEADVVMDAYEPAIYSSEEDEYDADDDYYYPEGTL